MNETASPPTHQAEPLSFYALRPFEDQLFGRRFAYATVQGPHKCSMGTERDHCPRCGDTLGPLQWLPPHRVKLSSRHYPDLLWGAGFDLMVSERFRHLYEAAGLSGIKRFDPPAEIVKVGGKAIGKVEPPPRYHNIWYLRGGAHLDGPRSNVRRPRGLCLYCRQGVDAVRRVVLRPGSWMGADFFEAYGLPGTILVTERCKALVEEHQITNAELIPAEAYRFSSRSL